MEQNLYRKESMEKVTSPDQLNDYIRVAKPSVWILLAAVIILLSGIVCWSIFGHITTSVRGACSVGSDSAAYLYVSPDDASKLKTGMGDVVLGTRLAKTLSGRRILTKTAIDEILKYYHVPSQDLPADITDINDQLEYLLRPSGIMRRAVKLSGPWYKDSIGAMLGVLRESGTPVALLPAGIGYTYFDPGTQKKVHLNRKTAAALDSEAFCFYKPLPLKSISVPDIMLYIFRCLSKSDFVLIAAAALAAALIGLLIPKLSQIIYGNVVSGTDMMLFYAVFFFLASVSITMLLINTAKTLLTERVETKMTLGAEAAGMTVSIRLR